MLMVDAAMKTAAISAVAVAIGICLGILICGANLSRSRPLSVAARLYISFFRGVPLLVQLLLFYHLLPAIGLNISSLSAAILALSLCTAAYQAENLRGGFLSVPRGMVEAAEIVGMTHWQQFLRIKMPIAIRLTVPAMINEAIAILHASALISVVGVVELTKTAREISADTFDPLPAYATAGFLYLILNLILSSAGAFAEKRLKVGVA